METRDPVISPRPNSVEADASQGTAGTRAVGHAPGSRLLWQLGAALVLLLAAYVGIGRWRGQLQWERFRREAAAVEGSLEAREPSRPVLWGEAQDGSAWTCYARALALMPPGDAGHTLASLGRQAGAALSAGLGDGAPGRADETPPTATPASPASPGGPEGAGLPRLEEVLASHRDALVALREGAHRRDPRRPADWAAGFNMPVLNLLQDRALANAAVVAAIAATRDGRHVEAVHLLLDGLQLGRDRMQSPVLIEQMVGCATLTIVCADTLAWANLLRHLDGDALALFADGLARLDASLPLGSDWLASETVYFAHHIDGTPAARDELLGDLTWRSWKSGFSPRLLLANYGLARLRLACDVQGMSRRADALELGSIERRFADFRHGRSSVPGLDLPHVESTLRNRLHTIARVRLLRMATQYARGAEVEALSDPVGGTLQWAVDSGGEAAFWSDDDPRVRLTVRPR
ncbi:MAG: hypothetical protein R3F56_14540 [Planctomycetota bacterium]